MGAIIFFIFGTIAGSFMNVCIYRLPDKKSLVMPGSHCPLCRTGIAWYDNIPVLSFFILGGRCRACKGKISFVYPLVEILSGLATMFLFLRFGVTVKFFIYWYFVSSLIVVSFIDLKHHLIPDVISLSGIAAGILAAGIYPPLMGKASNLSSFADSLLGVILGGASIYAIGYIGEFVFKKEAMGGGDVKLLAMIGAFLGWKLALFTFFLAPFFGAIIGLALRKKGDRGEIPYGPHLSLAAIIALFYGDEILRRIFCV